MGRVCVANAKVCPKETRRRESRETSAALFAVVLRLRLALVAGVHDRECPHIFSLGAFDALSRVLKEPEAALRLGKEPSPPGSIDT